MASGPITSWKIEGEEVEAMADFIFLGSKIIETKRCLLLGRKTMTNPDRDLTSRDAILLAKVHIFQVMVLQ